MGNCLLCPPISYVLESFHYTISRWWKILFITQGWDNMITFKRRVRRSKNKKKGKEGIKRMASVLIIKRQVIRFLEWHPKWDTFLRYIPDLSEPGVLGVAWHHEITTGTSGFSNLPRTLVTLLFSVTQWSKRTCLLLLICPRLSIVTTNPSNFDDPIGTCFFR